MNEAKNEILSRISRANVPPFTAARPPVIPSARLRESVIDGFAEYVAEYRANVVRCMFADLPRVLAELVGDRVVIPPDLPEDWGVHGVPDLDLDYRELAAMDSVVTGCAIGIAETGTLVLDAGPGQGRRALSLIPDHHVCVVFEDQVVDTIPEAVDSLAQAAAEGRPQTWISGPSATSDIELSRVEGVHGPRKLDVILVARK